jgi:hypothetical protein
MTFNIQSRLPSAQFNLESIPDADRLNIARSALLKLSNQSDRYTWLKAYLKSQGAQTMVEVSELSSAKDIARYRLDYQPRTESDPQPVSLCLTISNSRGHYDKSLADCQRESCISNSLSAYPQLAKHSALSLGVVVLTPDFFAQKKLKAGEQSNKLNTDPLFAQVTTLHTGKTLQELVAIEYKEVSKDQLSQYINDSIKAMIQMWRGGLFCEKHIVHHPGLDGISIEHGTPIFLDLDGGKRLDQENNLMVALSQFRKSLMHSVHPDIKPSLAPLVAPEALAKYMVNGLGPSIAKQLVMEANSNRKDFSADFRSFYLPKISDIIDK